MPPILSEWLGLSMYTLFMGFCFCDGFGLNIGKKLIWFAVYLSVCFYSFFVQQHFHLVLIISAGSLAAFLICGYHVMINKKKLRRQVPRHDRGVYFKD